FNGTVIAQGSELPVFSDTWPTGINYRCGHCGRMVLVVGVADDQLWDICFECFGCKRLSVSPSLPPGMALPLSCLRFPQARYRIDLMSDMRRGVFAGETAVARRVAEAGRKCATFGRNIMGVGTLDADLLRSWVQQLRDLLGAKYDKLYLSDKRATTSPTPPKH